MANMILGGYTFVDNPADISPPLYSIKRCASVGTYAGVEYFSWGSTSQGMKFTLKWEIMSTGQYDAIDALYKADTVMSFDPQEAAVPVYSVMILDFHGTYFRGMGLQYRKDCELILLVMSPVVSISPSRSPSVSPSPSRSPSLSPSRSPSVSPSVSPSPSISPSISPSPSA